MTKAWREKLGRMTGPDFFLNVRLTLLVIGGWVVGFVVLRWLVGFILNTVIPYFQRDW